MAKHKLLSVIVPVYNEQEVLEQFYLRIKKVLQGGQFKHELLFIDDGSVDSSYKILSAIAKKDSSVLIIKFSRNFGHQAAISAGIENASGDAAVIIDADLQDPPEVIPLLTAEWEKGYDVVYAKRKKRRGDFFLVRLMARIFYRVLGILSSVKLPLDTGDFRLIDRKVCTVIKAMGEYHRYIRGLVSWAGFRQKEITYIREKRASGKSTYGMYQRMRLAVNALTSFSPRPLKLASMIGMLTFLGGLGYLGYAVYQYFFTSETVPGWTSIIALLVTLNGISYILLGIMGEYIGRIFEEVKKRPLYVIDSIQRPVKKPK